MNDFLSRVRLHKRRTFLTQACRGVGAVALGSLFGTARAGEPTKGVIAKPHVPPKAKRVIFLVMAGGASHLELWDNKPELAKRHGQPFPESITKGQPIAQLQGAKLTCFAPQWGFKKHGKSGQEFNELFTHLPEVADDLCIVRSIKTEAINHDPAHTFMNTGSTVSGRPSMGSWLTYGLGSDADDLPGFVVLTSSRGGQMQPIASRQWSAGFLPGKHQGVHLRGQGDPVLYVRNPKGVTDGRQKDVIEAVAKLNQLENEMVDDPEIATRISQYELAFRMQSGVPDLVDFSKETQKTLDLYGTKGGDGSFASNCLLARRLAERGVRFIQLYHRDWDHHGAVKDHSAGTAKEVDQGVAALLTDLKQRDMLKDTLVVFGTEFGRTPMAQGNGRDHHLAGFSVWMAGGGVKGGMTYGATDEFGYHAVEDKKLTYKYQGRDFRLTDIAGDVIQKVLA